MIKVFHKIPREFKPQIQRLIDIAFRSTDEDLDEEAEEFYTLERDRFA